MSKEWKIAHLTEQLSDLEEDVKSIRQQLRVEQNPVTRNRLKRQIEQQGKLMEKVQQLLEERKTAADASETLDGDSVERNLVSKYKDVTAHRTKFTPVIKSSTVLSLFITGGIVLIRFTGLFETIELQLFDHLLRSRSTEPPDSRIVVVEATEDDLVNQRERNEEGVGSISDRALDEILGKVNQAEVIALDLYRDFDQSKDPIANRLKNTSQIIGICEQPNIDNERGINPPSESVIKTENIGFSNLLLDKDSVLRRQLLVHRNPLNEHLCRTDESFGFLVALRFLRSTTGLPKSDNEVRKATGDLVLQENFPVKRIDSFEYAGYRDLEVTGVQTLLNYRDSRYTLREVAPHYSMQSIRNGDIPESLFKNKIVLIGLTAPSEAIDYTQTPYREKISGVTIHAHIVSQIISYVLDGRPLLWVFPQWQEVILILTGAGAGSYVAFYLKSKRWFFLLVSGGVISIYIFSLILIRTGGWLPLFPILLAFLLSTTAVRLKEFFTTILFCEER